MLFNSIDFVLFLPIVFVLYWFVTNKSLKIQNILLLVSSYYFYACWDYRFLFLLIFSTFLDYFSGIKINSARNEKIKKFWLWLSIIINLGFLGVFKYFNFFSDSLADALSTIGFQTNFWTLQILLPVGISFYTFHGLSYVIDIYKQRIEPEKNFIDYSVFVSFFPLLVAGPIERATHLLPQIQKPRQFDYNKAIDGLRQMLWGFFKKIVIADNCATFVNPIFENTSSHSGSTLVVAALFFTFQIYCDFSGYSDIALGTARLFGIELLRNFAFPYFSRDIAEFWRRWHISLTTWFRDYLYIPLGGSKGGLWMKVRNTFIIFLVSGFWHGANWTFIAWGFLNALYFIPLLLLNKNRSNLEIVAQDKWLPSVREFTGILITFALTVFAWIFFRADSISQAILYISRMLNPNTFLPLDHNGLFVFGLISILIIAEWVQRRKKHALEFTNMAFPLRWGIYYFLLYLISYYKPSVPTDFIYFQF